MESLLDRTKALAKKSGLTGAQICVGADVGYRWYCKMMSGEIKDPGVNRIQRLHDYLSSTDVKAAA